MASESSGRGQVFWQLRDVARFKADRSQFFDVNHDGQLHDYAIAFETQAPLVAIRIDPSRGEGRIEITRVRLVDGLGQAKSLLEALQTDKGSMNPSVR